MKRTISITWCQVHVRVLFVDPQEAIEDKSDCLSSVPRRSATGQVSKHNVPSHDHSVARLILCHDFHYVHIDNVNLQAMPAIKEQTTVQ